MVKRVHSLMNKSRQKLSKSIRQSSRVRIRTFLQSFKEGEKVALKADSSYQRGMYHLRFHGKTGLIVGTNGTCYKVKIRDFQKEKTLIVHPVHLKKVE